MSGTVFEGDGWTVTTPEGPHAKGCDARHFFGICDCGLVVLEWHR